MLVMSKDARNDVVCFANELSAALLGTAESDECDNANVVTSD